jgi:subtilisin family serine protease
LQNAKANGQVIFAAAGNDSNLPANAIQARYASPFNWAALEASKFGIDSGVIVEAHDANGSAASFTNSPGHISCGGVDVLSAVALDNAGQPSTKSYGVMSGTSMASPLCAGAFELLRKIRPAYTVEALLTCVRGGARKNSNGTPIFDLESATQLCP